MISKQLFMRKRSKRVYTHGVFFSSSFGLFVCSFGKPFLSVMGASGVMVDGHHILPSAGSGEPTIVPLQDHSLFIIHNKIFRFDYPTSSTRPILTVLSFFSSLVKMCGLILFRFRHHKLNAGVLYECLWSMRQS